eukprot:scaffold8033_cov42-Attheya_sp.AAC.2
MSNATVEMNMPTLHRAGFMKFISTSGASSTVSAPLSLNKSVISYYDREMLQEDKCCTIKQN